MDNYMHIIAGAALAAFGLLGLFVIWRRKRWPEIEAKILISRVCEEEPAEMKANTLTGGMRSGAFSRRSKSMKMHATYTPYLLYQYRVDGKLYQSKNMYSGPFSYLDNNILRFFSEGSFYPARFNPSNPENTYLMFSPAWRYWMVVLAGGCIGVYPEIIDFVSQYYADFVSNK